jgi:hypothetical protein
MLIVLASNSGDVSQRYGAQGLPLLLIPFVLGGVGLYLLRDGSLIHRVAFQSDGHESTIRLAELFTLGVKLYGIYLVIGNIPVLATLLSNFLFVANSIDYGTGHGIAEGLGMRTNFLPTLVSMLFGVLLIFRGELLSSWAFAERRNVKDTD